MVLTKSRPKAKTKSQLRPLLLLLLPLFTAD
jgi:hypothetical protein